MESALPFCNYRDLLNLAAVHSRIRTHTFMSKMLRVLHEALDCDEKLGYLRYLCPVNQASFRDANIKQLAERIIAHALFSGANTPALVGGIEDVVKTLTPQRKDDEPFISSTRARYLLVRGDVAQLDAEDIESCVNGVARIIATGFGVVTHYAWLDEIIIHASATPDMMREIAIGIYAGFAASRINERACGEWIECWIIRDVERAHAIFPFSLAALTALFAIDIPYWILRERDRISIDIMPRFAQLLMQHHSHDVIIARSAFDSPEMDVCFANMRETCARVQMYMDASCKTSRRCGCSRSNVLDKRHIEAMLCSSARNPDPQVFARMFAIVQSAECVEKTYNFEWATNDDVETLLQVVRRMESVGIRVSFHWIKTTREIMFCIMHLPRYEAAMCADIMLARWPQAKLRQSPYVQAQAFKPAIDMFGAPLARVVRSYFGWAPEPYILGLEC